MFGLAFEGKKLKVKVFGLTFTCKMTKKKDMFRVDEGYIGNLIFLAGEKLGKVR